MPSMDDAIPVDDLLAEAPDRPFTAEEQERADRIISWLEEKWGLSRPCPFCDVSDWRVDPRFMQVRHITEPPLVVVYITVVCANCGHAVWLNASHIGVFPTGRAQ